MKILRNELQLSLRRLACGSTTLLGLMLMTAAGAAQDFSYAVANGTATITLYNGTADEVTIPSTIDGLPVTGIGPNVFVNRNRTLTQVGIPNTVTNIGNSAFYGCSSLAQVILPSGLRAVQDSTFFECSSLTNVVIPEGLIEIDSAAFAYCTKLPGVNIPNAVTIIASSAFIGCSSLAQVTLPTGLTAVQGFTFSGCSSLTNVVIPEGVTEIDAQAFQGCISLTTVAIPASTLSIQMSTFDNPMTAFGGCTGLTAINVDPQNSVYSSVDGVMFNKDRSQVLLCPQGKRGNYVMPNSVIVVGDSAFANCSNLTDVTIAGSVTELRYHAFDSCVSLTSIRIPDSVTNIWDARAGCFGSCVDGGVFGGCTSLTNVVVGKGLTYLGLGAFTSCSNLLSVYFKGNAPSLGFTVVGYEDIFGLDSTTVYYLPGTTGWGSTLAGRPALLWNPQIQTGEASFGVRGKGFGFNVTGTLNIPIVIEACTNRGDGSYVPLQSCTLTNGLVNFSDPQWTNYPSRFYRIRSP